MLRRAKRRTGLWGTIVAVSAVAAALSACGPARSSSSPTALVRWRAMEITPVAPPAEAGELGRPTALSVDRGTLYIADADDGSIKAFASNGTFLRSFGRKGQGPGELSLPSGVSARDGRIYVADKLNARISIFDASGEPRGGWGVGFMPDKVRVLGDGSVLVAASGASRIPGAMLLHLYGPDGHALWQGLEVRLSSDAVFDAFENMVLVCPGPGREFFVVRRTGTREILRFEGAEGPAGTVRADERLALRPLDLPFEGPRKRLLGFCWAADSDRGALYLSPPEPIDGKDLGPGRSIFVLDGTGRAEAVIDLPCAVARFAIDADRLFVIDEEGRLRVFGVDR